jgi:hypothetical protein
MARQLWVKDLRRAFSPGEMLNDDASLNQAYFRPVGAMVFTEKSWSSKERDLLIQGIGEFGVGYFADISRRYLSDWSPQDLRSKCQRLLGRQNLQEYKGWRGNAAEVESEYNRNRAVGELFNTWKSNTLVLDDDGKVAAYLEQHPITCGSFSSLV